MSKMSSVNKPRNGMKYFWIATGMALGAALAYVLDPDNGRRRRALVKDKGVHLAHQSGRYVSRRGRDLGHRALGWMARTKKSVTNEVFGREEHRMKTPEDLVANVPH